MTRSVLSISLLIATLLFLQSCDTLFKRKTNWAVSLGKEDKKPYGAYLAFQSLRHFFPGAKITDLSPGFRYSTIDDAMMHQPKRSLFVAAGLDFYLSQAELKNLIKFVREGNEVAVFGRSIDKKLEQLLGYRIVSNGEEEAGLTKFNNGRDNLGKLSIYGLEGRRFGYQGKALKATFRIITDSSGKEPMDEVLDAEIRLDTLVADTLGFFGDGPDILRFKIGQGHLTLHAAPLSISNYFLLQPGNLDYLQAFWNTFPSGIGHVYWNDYYKRDSKTADLGVLLRYPATRWAFFLALFTLLIYLLFESKRKQRIMAEIKPLENSSVSFAETIGRLYYNRANHTNLGEKMIQHFLEWVRTHYFISTSRLDDQFARSLQVRSGLPSSVVNSMMELIREVHIERKQITEADLYHLHQTIQQFYNSHTR